MRLIGINGFKTSGKDTTYAIIRELVEGTTVDGAPPAVLASERVERRAFADNLKIMAMLALGFSGTDDRLIEYADGIKESGYIETGIPSVLSNTFVERKITGREYLQFFGAHAREVFGDSFWVDQVLPCPNEKALAYSSPQAVIEANGEFDRVWGTLGRRGERVGLPAIGCVTDVRYPNEAERVLQLGGEVLEIVRPGIESDGHSSEIPLERHLVTHTIVNDSSLDDLREKVSCYLEPERILV